MFTKKEPLHECNYVVFKLFKTQSIIFKGPTHKSISENYTYRSYKCRECRVVIQDKFTNYNMTPLLGHDFELSDFI